MNDQSAVPGCVYNAAPEWELSDISPEQARATSIEEAIDKAQRTGCDALLVPTPLLGVPSFPDLLDDPDRNAQTGHDASDVVGLLRHWAQLARERGISLIIDVDMVHVAADGAFAHRWPHAYARSANANAIDPRMSRHDTAQSTLVTAGGRMDPALLEDWQTRIASWLHSGIVGVRFRHLVSLPAADVISLLTSLKKARPDIVMLGDTAGLAPVGLEALRQAGFDAVFSSLPWWDFRSPWLVEEHARLERVAPAVVACAALRHDDDVITARRKLYAAAMTGDILMVCAGGRSDHVDSLIAEATAWHRAAGVAARGLRWMASPALGVVALFRGDGMAFASEQIPGAAARLLVVNPQDSGEVIVDWNALLARLPGGYADISLATAPGERAVALPDLLAPGEVLPAWVQRTAPVTATVGGSAQQRPPVAHALLAPRIAIEAVSPVVDDGRFALKRTVGQPIDVQADVFMDGHDHIAVSVQWRAADEIGWHEVPMKHMGNDRYAARFAGQRVGRHEFKVCAWRDAWATYRDELAKKHAAGLNVSLEIEEGRRLVHHMRAQLVHGHVAAEALDQVLGQIGEPRDTRVAGAKSPGAQGSGIPAMNVDHVVLLLSDATAAAMHEAGHRPFLSESERTYPVNVERQAASFASWYELFPRSQSGSADRHGTFADVIGRLPAIRDMGFDVLYFPPIHPIGLRNRKGKNNTLNAGADQPGSPYAIGSADGGHSDVHPELGTLEDFQRLIAAAQAHGLEIALDFAIQCSPDHPWLKDHPQWFAWRADGSMRYAENPPKKYEDIVNVDFYSEGADDEEKAGLWRALRDVILFWVEQGVRTFRVDNPHTKPLPFWEWMIHDVQSQFPDTLFLSEAFTRPKMMYRLAKAGFSQSYTYFTWREHKDEFAKYLLELNSEPARDIFRPNFFVNTPDINPRFLQRSGRAGHLIRMALAATTSGLWGVYSGFELCEATPMPGKEEYLDSEKYEIRVWDWNRPGNIVAEVAAINAIRRQNPALQTHLGLTLQTIYNDQILLFTKATPERDNVILVAVNMDPTSTQSGQFELPLWEFGLGDDAALHVSDLIAGNALVWRGKQQWLSLSAEQPYGVWRLDGPA